MEDTALAHIPPQEVTENKQESTSLLDKIRATKEEQEEERGNNLYSRMAKPTSTATKIKGTIPLNLKFRYLNDLFDGNNAVFEESIEVIDSSADYHTAVSLVKERYIRVYNWDLGEDTTREFLSMISRKFE